MAKRKRPAAEGPFDASFNGSPITPLGSSNTKRRRMSVSSGVARLFPIDENQPSHSRILDLVPHVSNGTNGDAGSVASNAGSVASGLSASSEVHDQRHELEELCATRLEIPNPSDTIEAQMLCEPLLADPNCDPNVDKIKHIIESKPRSSFLLMSGFQALENNEAVLYDTGVRAEFEANNAKERTAALFKEKQRLGLARNRALEALVEAETQLAAVEWKIEAITTTNEIHEHEHRAHTRRSNLCKSLRELSEYLKPSTFRPFADMSIQDVRDRLGIESPEAVADLSRDDLLSILRVMHLCCYESNPTFQRFWMFPPQGFVGDLGEWFAQYGRTPTVLTGNNSANMPALRKRLLNYLGFADPVEPPVLHRNMTPEQQAKAIQFLVDLGAWTDVGDEAAGNGDADAKTLNDGDTKTVDEEGGETVDEEGGEAIDGSDAAVGN